MHVWLNGTIDIPTECCNMVLSTLKRRQRMKDVYSTVEAAQYLSMSYDLLMYYVKTRQLKVTRVGNRYIVTKKDLDKFRNRKNSS